MSKRRVVITGMGAVTPLGIGVPVFAEALREGISGIRLLRHLDTSGVPTKGGGEVLEPLPSIAGLPAASPRFVHLAAVAFQEAWRQAGLNDPLSQNENHPACDPVPPERLGVLLGTSRGVVRELEIACDLLRRQGPVGLQAEAPDLLAMLFPTFGASILGRSIATLAKHKARSARRLPHAHPVRLRSAKRHNGFATVAVTG